MLVAPIIVTILLVHAFLAPEELPIGIFLVLANLFVAYHYRESYKPLLRA